MFLCQNCDAKFAATHIVATTARKEPVSSQSFPCLTYNWTMTTQSQSCVNFSKWSHSGLPLLSLMTTVLLGHLAVRTPRPKQLSLQSLMEDLAGGLSPAGAGAISATGSCSSGSSSAAISHHLSLILRDALVGAVHKNRDAGVRAVLALAMWVERLWSSSHGIDAGNLRKDDDAIGGCESTGQQAKKDSSADLSSVCDLGLHSVCSVVMSYHTDTSLAVTVLKVCRSN